MMPTRKKNRKQYKNLTTDSVFEVPYASGFSLMNPSTNFDCKYVKYQEFAGAMDLT